MDTAEGDLYIIDTDCGSDDAMAIVLAMRKHANKILAITCCYGNAGVDQVCQNVMRTLLVCGQLHIPVFRGCTQPLLGAPAGDDAYSEEVHGVDGLGGCSAFYPSGETQVVEDEPGIYALTRIARKYPGKVTLICLAPLTNIALAHRLDDAFTRNLKKIVFMGGNYKGIGNVTETAEFNFYSDPEAANVVLRESICPVTMVPWETTMDYGIDWDYYSELMSLGTRKSVFLHRATKAVADFCRKERDPMFYDCDLLAMAAALYPQSIVSTLKKAAAVECQGLHSRGLVILKRQGTASLEIVQHFDSEVLRRIRKDMLLDD